MVKSEAVPVLAGELCSITPSFLVPTLKHDDEGFMSTLSRGSVTFTISFTAVVPKAEEADVALRQIEEELKQKEGVLKEVVMAAAPSEKAMKEVAGDWLI